MSTENKCLACDNYIPSGLRHQSVCDNCLINNTKQIRLARYNNINNKHNGRNKV